MTKPQIKSEVNGSGEMVKSGTEPSVAKASKDVVDVAKTTGQSPGSEKANLPIKMYLVKAPEMARLLNVPLSAIYEHTRKGTIPHVRFGKYCRFDPVEVIAYFKRAIADKPGKQPQPEGACGIIAPTLPITRRQPDQRQQDSKGNHDGTR